MWAVWFIRWINLLYIAPVAKTIWFSDNLVSASLFVRLSVTLVTKAYQTEKLSRLNNGTMCRGSNVKDKLVTAFQLESLILAQNERWRHA